VYFTIVAEELQYVFYSTEGDIRGNYCFATDHRCRQSQAVIYFEYECFLSLCVFSTELRIQRSTSNNHKSCTCLVLKETRTMLRISHWH